MRMLNAALPALVSAFVALALSSPASCRGDQTLPRTFHNSQLGFSLSIPADWDRMDPQRLGQINEMMRPMHPEWTPPLFHDGYQMTGGTPEMKFRPFVVIRVAESHNPPDPEAIRRDLETHDFPAGMEKTGVVFDPELNAWMAQLSVRWSNAPSIDSFVAYYLTKKSVVKMIVHTPHDTDHPFASIAQQILKSVRISDENRIVQDKPASTTALISALIAIVVMAVVLIRPNHKVPPEKIASPTT